jgi:REP element-mobilizing transposase RayT
MARPLRLEFPGAVYHVTSRGIERRAIVRDDRDRARWLDLLDTVATRRRWQVYAFALMGNHLHLFLRTPNANLSAGMHDLNSGYATGFNRRHRRVGPLCQGRFKALRPEPSVEDIERVVCEACGVEPDSLRRRGRHGNEPRRLAIALSRELTTLPLREIGARFGGIGPGAVSNVVRQVTGRRRSTRRLATLRRQIREADQK